MKVEKTSSEEYIANSVPCRIRYTGEHETISTHLIKVQEKDEVITYIRGRKLHGELLNVTEEGDQYKGHIVTSSMHSDNLQSHGTVSEIVYFERDGVPIERPSMIKEFIQVANLVREVLSL